MATFLDDGIFHHLLLNCDEERRLLLDLTAERERGEVDGPARAALVLHHLRLAVKLAARYQGRGMDFDDLVSEAVCGLLRAADLFDVEHGVRFCTYASYWVVQYIQYAIAYQGRTVRFPGHVVTALSKLWKLNERCWQCYGRPPKRHEIIRYLKCTKKWADEFVRVLNQKCLSLDYEVGLKQDSVSFFYTDPGCPDPVEEASRREQAEHLREAVRRLPARQRKVIRLRFGLDGPPLTLQDIADMEGVSKERIRQIEVRALDRLRLMVRPESVEG